MKRSPLYQRLVAVVLAQHYNNPDQEGMAEDVCNRILEVIAEATPEQIIEEGTYLLGASHLWSDTQGSKATEHMVRRLLAADQVVRGRLEKEVAKLTDLLAEVEWTCDDPDSKSSPLFCPRCGGLKRADKESGTPAGHAVGCLLAAAIDRNT